MAYSKTIMIRLTPKASSDRVGDTRILPTGEEVLVIYVTAPPDKNKANQAMLRILAHHLNIAESRLTIIRGQTNRNKLVGIE